MKAIEISQPGPPDVLRLVERPTPSPGPDEVLVRVKAAGVNRPDIMFWGLERRRQFDQAYEFGTIAVPIPGAETPGEVLCARLRRAAFELRPPLRRR